MSDFKFNCPSCGQKIACDTGYTGSQIACPACKKTLTVPAATGGATAAPVAAAVSAAPAATAVAAPISAATAAPPAARPPAGAPAQPKPSAPRPLPQVPDSLQKSPALPAGVISQEDPGYCTLAIVSLISSVVLVIGWIPGIICGHLAKARMRRNPLLDGNGIATAGLLISYAMLVLILGTTAGFTMFLRGLKPVQVVREAPADMALLQPRIVDEVQPNDPSSESSHGMMVRTSRSGNMDPTHRWRDAAQGGFIRYTMKVLPDHPMSVNCRYWGNDTQRRLFDVVVDDQIIGTQKIDFNVPGHYFDVEYKIPASLTKGKNQVTVELAAHPGMVAGGVFGIQTLKR